MRSRILLALIAALAVSLPQTPAGAAVDQFVDDDNSRFESFIETAAELGIVTSCNLPTGDRVCPARRVTRAELATMVARVVDAEAGNQDFFTDDDGHPAEAEINSLARSGSIHGCADGAFCPDRPIRRSEMASIIVRALGVRTQHSTAFSDLDESASAAAVSSLASTGGLLACDPPLNRNICPDAYVRRDEAAFAIVKAMGATPAVHIPDPPEMERLEFGDDFERLELWDGRNPGSRNRVSITDSGFTGTGLRVGIPKGAHFGADFKLDLTSRSGRVREHLFFRYYLRLDSDWSTAVSGKLPGFSGVYGASGKGGYQSSPDDPGWSARLMFSPAGADNLVPIGYYVYHLGQAREYGDGMYWNEAGRLRPGDWYCLEGEVEINSPGLDDGALRAWVDETPAFEIDGLQFRRPEEPQITIESFWFDVYYGGKPVAPRDLGLTIDEVVVDTNRIGCGESSTSEHATTGDVDGDGYADGVSWDSCPEGICFWQEVRASTGADAKRQAGDGGWFSVETGRFGLLSGDFNGDDLDDLLYRGRCDGAVNCWRVHPATSNGFRSGQNWGDSLRVGSRTDRLLVGDFDGDGRDDITYTGLCGDDAHYCLRTHLSRENGFAEPLDWGDQDADLTRALIGDIDGNGTDDLLYQTTCEAGVCWFGRTSGPNGFEPQRNLGRVAGQADRHLDLLDFDNDGSDDLVAWGGAIGSRTVTVRLMGDETLGTTKVAGVFGSSVNELHLRKVTATAPVQAIAHLACGERTTCIEYRVVVAGRVLAVPTRPGLSAQFLPHVV